MDQSFALKSDQIGDINSIYKTLIQSILPEDRQDSMYITYLENQRDKSSNSICIEEKGQIDNQSSCKIIFDQKLCIDPLCMEKTRQVTQQISHQDHKDKIMTLQHLLQSLKVLKNNEKLKKFNQSRSSMILKSLQKLWGDLLAFQREVSSILRKIKQKTLKHMTQVRQSFQDKHYQAIKKKVIDDFNYSNVTYALEQIQKYEMLRYDNLEYPLFKVNILNSRVNENNKKNKEVILQKLKAWSDHLLGYHHNYNKKFNRSVETFMFKSLSEKRIFSYYLKSQDYLVTNLGKRLQRIDKNQVIPVAVIQKKLSQDKTLVKVKKIGKGGVVIGCGILRQMQKRKFNNCYGSGFFLDNNGLVFTANEKVQARDIFKYGQGDIISLHKEGYRIYFHKIQQNKVVDGFYVNLKPFQEEGSLNAKENYYAAVFLGDIQSQLQVFT